MEISLEKKIEIAFSEVDSLKIVWHGNFIKYFEDVREAFGRKYNFGYMDFYDNGFMTPIVDLNVSYKKMVEYGDILTAKINYVPVDSAKIVFTYKITNHKNEIVCKGSTTQVITTLDKKLVLISPDFVQNWKKKMMVNKI
jgi:acyl-CoA thioester hydrolase